MCHFPPGTSKRNKIEHRLFSHISMNWRGRPLTSHEVIVQTIAATTTRTGLTVSAELDPGQYPKGIKISDRQIDEPGTRNLPGVTPNARAKPTLPPMTRNCRSSSAMHCSINNNNRALCPQAPLARLIGPME